MSRKSGQNNPLIRKKRNTRRRTNQHVDLPGTYSFVGGPRHAPATFKLTEPPRIPGVARTSLQRANTPRLEVQIRDVNSIAIDW